MSLLSLFCCAAKLIRVSLNLRFLKLGWVSSLKGTNTGTSAHWGQFLAGRLGPATPFFLTFLALALAGTWPARAQSPASQRTLAEDSELANQLPSELRRQGMAILDPQNRSTSAAALSAMQKSGGVAVTPFLIALVDANRCPRDRRYCSRLLAASVADSGDAQARAALERWAGANDDPELARIAFEQLYSADTAPLRKLLDKRREDAQASSDPAALKRYAQMEQQWLPLLNGSSFPPFLYQAPPLFAVKPAEASIRFVAFGDFGNSSEDEKIVAGEVLKIHEKKPFDFGITLGDNFYPRGAESTSDPRWHDWWEKLYGRLGIPFYPSLGNHDWLNSGSAAAEVLYSRQSHSWQMPSPYYTYTAGPAQFFALDTACLTEAELLWLKDELQKSRAKWKIVYAHHPFYSATATRGDNKMLIERLLPLLKDSADLYIAGHDHNLQVFKPEGKLHFIVAGGGGANLYDMRQSGRIQFKSKAHGFAVVDVNERRVEVKLVDSSGKTLYENEITS